MKREDNNTFSEEVSNALGYYVYRLIDPRNGETFYVGKGKGNRVFHHASGCAVESKDGEDNTDNVSPKIERIKEILNEGLEVIHVIHRHDLNEAVVFEVEAALIDAYAGLTNMQGGHGSDSKGPMNHMQIIRKYSLPSLDAGDVGNDKIVLINVNALKERNDHKAKYDQVRFCWKINKTRASKADYVLAVVRGVVVGVYTAREWLPAIRENFPEIPHATDDDYGRYGFHGGTAPAHIWEKYVGEYGKRITDDRMKHIQNPIRYWNL